MVDDRREGKNKRRKRRWQGVDEPEHCKKVGQPQIARRERKEEWREGRNDELSRRGAFNGEGKGKIRRFFEGKKEGGDGSFSPWRQKRPDFPFLPALSSPPEEIRDRVFAFRWTSYIRWKKL